MAPNRAQNRVGKAAALACLFALPILSSCTTTIPPINPTPNIALVPQSKSLELAFAPAVPDRIDVAYGSNTITAPSWRQTLQSGFHNGFRGAYPPKHGASPDLTLRLDKTQLEVGSFDHTSVRIQYAATLIGADGTVRRASGIASRPAPMSEAWGVYSDFLGQQVSATVSDMYEQLAKELLGDSTSARCVPGQSTACVGPKGCQGFQVCASDGARFAPCTCN